MTVPPAKNKWPFKKCNLCKLQDCGKIPNARKLGAQALTSRNNGLDNKGQTSFDDTSKAGRSSEMLLLSLKMTVTPRKSQNKIQWTQTSGGCVWQCLRLGSFAGPGRLCGTFDSLAEDRALLLNWNRGQSVENILLNVEEKRTKHRETWVCVCVCVFAGEMLLC